MAMIKSLLESDNRYSHYEPTDEKKSTFDKSMPNYSFRFLCDVSLYAHQLVSAIAYSN